MNDHNVHAPQFREAKPPQGLVTGAMGFLGRETAVAVMESGADVVGLDIKSDTDGEEWTKVQMRATELDCKAWYLHCDTTNEKDISPIFSIIQQLIRHPIRGLVACAGISDNGPSIDFPIHRFRELFKVNVEGTFNIAQATAQEMRRASVSGSMVLVASMSGQVANKGVDTAGYNSSKAAVQQLARSLAAEWGSRIDQPLIRVNSLSPGYIRTAATEGALKKPGMEQQWMSDNMLNRLSTVDEFRAPIIYMLSDGSSFMTGTDLRVDGGHCAW